MRRIAFLLFILLLLISGCVVKSEPDKDLSENQLDAIVSLYASDNITKSLGVYSDVYSKVYNQGVSQVVLAPSSQDKVNIEINVNINIDISDIKNYLNLTKWQGPDEYGWYTMYFDLLLKKSYIKVRYFSMYKKLEFVVYKDGYLTDFAFSKSGYMIFNKDVKQNTEGAYPVELKVSYYALWNSQKGYQNKFGFTLYLDNLNIVTLSKLTGKPKLLEGDFVFYFTHKDYDNNINIDNKEIISAKTDVIGENTQNPSLYLSGKHITGDVYQSNDYVELKIYIPLSSYFN